MNSTKQLLNEKDLIEVQSLIPDIVFDLKYATTDNFTGRKHYSEPRCFLLKQVVQQLAQVQKKLGKEGLGLKIWDAYRPASVQQEFIKHCPNTDFVAAVSNHSRGIAVDLTIIKKSDGTEIEMPTKFDDFTEYAKADCEKLPEKIIQNREKLKELMARYGFTVYPNEWWHYDYLSLKDSEVLDILI